MAVVTSILERVVPFVQRTPKPRRVARIDVALDIFLGFFAFDPFREEGRVVALRFSLFGPGVPAMRMPEDAHIVGIRLDQNLPPDTISLFLESERFPEVLDGHSIPQWQLMDTAYWIVVPQEQLTELLEHERG